MSLRKLLLFFFFFFSFELRFNICLIYKHVFVTLFFFLSKNSFHGPNQLFFFHFVDLKLLFSLTNTRPPERASVLYRREVEPKGHSSVSWKQQMVSLFSLYHLVWGSQNQTLTEEGDQVVGSRCAPGVSRHMFLLYFAQTVFYSNFGVLVCIFAPQLWFRKRTSHRALTDFPAVKLYLKKKTKKKRACVLIRFRMRVHACAKVNSPARSLPLFPIPLPSREGFDLSAARSKALSGY